MAHSAEYEQDSSEQMRDDLSGVSLLFDVMSEQTNKRTNKQHKSTIYRTSHQNSDLTLRLHNLQTAQFTEQRVDSNLRLTTDFILASPVHSRRLQTSMFTTQDFLLPRSRACTE